MSQKVLTGERGETTLLDNVRLTHLFESVQNIGAAHDLTAAQSRAALEANHLLGGAGAIVALKKEADSQATLVLAAYGKGLEEVISQAENPAGLGNLFGIESQTIISNDLKADGRWQPLKELRRAIITPLHWQDQQIGWVATYRVADNSPFAETEKALLEQYARLLGPVLGAAWRINLLEQGIEARDDFLSVAAHDLRNPLSSMRGFAQLIVRIMDKTRLDEPLPRERISNYLHRVVRQTDNINDLIEKILDFSRILSERLEPNTTLIELASLTREVVQRFEEWLDEQESSYAPEKRHRLNFEVASPDLEIEFDPSRLKQIINSLISNAIKYSPDGGAITLKLTRQGNAAYLSVQDEGNGIAPEKQPGVFERWKTPAESRESGLGISLFIATHVVERYQGTLNFDTTFGQGTTFTMKIPMSERK